MILYFKGLYNKNLTQDTFIENKTRRLVTYTTLPIIQKWGFWEVTQNFQK